MDAIALILSALTAGATLAVQETAGTAIRDAYQGLVNLIKRKFNKDTEAAAVLDKHAEDPETWEKPLAKTIRAHAVSSDLEILQAAEKLMTLIQSQKPASKYNVSITGNVQGMVQGDHTKVTMNFTDSPKKRTSKKR
jgi:hypothetical protein